MNHYKVYMFDIPCVHVSINADHKFSLVCIHKFYMHQDMLVSLTEIGSMLHLIKVYHCENCFRKRIMQLIFEYILEIKKEHIFQFLLVLLNTKEISVKPNWH